VDEGWNMRYEIWHAYGLFIPRLNEYPATWVVVFIAKRQSARYLATVVDGSTPL